MHIRHVRELSTQGRIGRDERSVDARRREPASEAGVT
jgi:hypothetical protein